MWDILDRFEELIDKAITELKGHEFDEIKQRIIDRLEEIE